MDDEKLVVRRMRGPGCNQRGLEDLIRALPVNLRGVEVGSYAGESSSMFASSGKFTKLSCVDPWPPGDWALAELEFDQIALRFPDVIKKIKGRSENVVAGFSDGSLDFVYIDANHAYDHVLQDIRLWLPKLRRGGIMAGHDYGQPAEKVGLQGVTRAVDEVFGKPHRYFADHSWWVDVGVDGPEIITYCTQEYAPCLHLWLAGVLVHGKASKAIVYADNDDVRQAQGPDAEKIVWRSVPKIPNASMPDHWRRKIDVLRDAHQKCVAPHFAWLDADAFAVRPFHEVWGKMGKNHLGATRMFTTRCRGDANAGVIFFRSAPELERFFLDWVGKTDYFAQTGEAGKWQEQHAFSVLAHEAFHGRHPYGCAPLSENLYNLEDDVEALWLERIALHRPSIIHAKKEWWRNSELMARALEAAKTPPAKEKK